jgi:hypothetical protein
MVPVLAQQDEADDGGDHQHQADVQWPPQFGG